MIMTGEGKNMIVESDKRYDLSDLEYPDVDIVECAKDWNMLDTVAKNLEDLGVKKFLIFKEDSGQYFGKSAGGRSWIDVTEAWKDHAAILEVQKKKKIEEDKIRKEAKIGPKVVSPPPNPTDEPYVSFDERFIKNRIAFQVAPYALADVLEALHRDQEHRVETVVTKEDGHLVVFFYREHKSVSNGMPEGEGTVYYPGAGKKVKVD